jgi:hypothetical protein
VLLAELHLGENLEKLGAIGEDLLDIVAGDLVAIEPIAS